MPRTIWSGAISFGLVSVPINVVGATEDHSIRFHQYHLEDMGRVRFRKVCELEDREVDQSEIGKGYELSKTQVIPITDEDLSNLPLPTAKAIEIDAFVPLESIDPLKIAEGYYLIAYAAVVMVLMAFCPTGVLGLIHRVTRTMRRRPASVPLGIERTEP